jgi:hypothetical protein
MSRIRNPASPPRDEWWIATLSCDNPMTPCLITPPHIPPHKRFNLSPCEIVCRMVTWHRHRREAARVFEIRTRLCGVQLVGAIMPRALPAQVARRDARIDSNQSRHRSSSIFMATFRLKAQCLGILLVRSWGSCGDLVRRYQQRPTLTERQLHGYRSLVELSPSNTKKKMKNQKNLNMTERTLVTMSHRNRR